MVINSFGWHYRSGGRNGILAVSPCRALWRTFLVRRKTHIETGTQFYAFQAGPDGPIKLGATVPCHCPVQEGGNSWFVLNGAK